MEDVETDCILLQVCDDTVVAMEMCMDCNVTSSVKISRILFRFITNTREPRGVPLPDHLWGVHGTQEQLEARDDVECHVQRRSLRRQSEQEQVRDDVYREHREQLGPYHDGPREVLGEDRSYLCVGRYSLQEDHDQDVGLGTTVIAGRHKLSNIYDRRTV